MMAVRRLRRASALILILAGLLTGISTVTATPAAHAATLSVGDRVLNMAETKVGHWYSYGSAGPTYFDCSGLVYWAAGRLGISLPRTTTGMLAGSTHLYRISLSQVRRGDLLFFGSGHVEINTRWYHTSFGAHHSGTTVGWRGWNGYYAPTMAMRLRLRGRENNPRPYGRGLFSLTTMGIAACQNGGSDTTDTIRCCSCPIADRCEAARTRERTSPGYGHP